MKSWVTQALIMFAFRNKARVQLIVGPFLQLWKGSRYILLDERRATRTTVAVKSLLYD